MPPVVFVRVNWDRTAMPFRMPGTRWFDLHVGPEPGYPFGRKGLAIDGAWRQLRDRSAAGMLLLDGDVAVDPLDYAAMLGAIAGEPRAVQVAPVRLWPASTTMRSWTWGHWDARGKSQEWVERPDRWTFCFTYLPRGLLHAARREGLREWTFPAVDMRMAECARKYRIPARLVPDCWPKHLHY